MSGESRKLIPFAIGAATATAGYTLVDGIGARISGEPLAYVGWLFVLSALFYPPALVALKGPEILRAPANEWRRGALPAGASFIAYAVVVWSMTQAPIALVAALRETSILFAVMIGWLIFGETMNKSKALAAALIILGVVLTRI